MNRTETSPRRISIGFAVGAVLVAAGFFLRWRAVDSLLNDRGGIDFTNMLQGAGAANRYAEAGLFFIVLGGLLSVIAFWRWLS